MSASRLLHTAALVPLLLLTGVVPVVVADDSDTQSAAEQDPAPVQVLNLTTSAGEATEVAEAGLDGSGAGSGQEPGSGSEAPEGAGNEADPSAGTVDDPGGPGGSVTPAVGSAGQPSLSLVADGAVDPEGDAALLTEQLEVSGFLVAGFTWSGGASLPEGAEIYLRVRESGTWSDWYANEAASAGPDDSAQGGTEEFITGGADAVQASVVAGANGLPTDLQLVLVPANPEGEEVLEGGEDQGEEQGEGQGAQEQPSPEEPAQEPQPEEQGGSGEGQQEAPPGAEDSSPEQTQPSDSLEGQTQPSVGEGGAAGAGALSAQPVALGATTTANGLPVPVTTRSEWGASSSYMTWSPSYVSASHVIVHHTAGTNSYTAGQSASIVNGIYYYHAVTLGWGDIGYNFLIDKYGQVFEGRYGSTSAEAGKMVVGGHALGVNTGTMGLSMMGTYTSVSPSDAQLQAVGKMAGWFLGRAGVTDVNGSASLLVRTTAKYQAGTTLSLPRIIGHRDVGYTECPGDVGYSRLGTIRSIAQQSLGSAAAPINTIYLNNSWSDSADITFRYGRSTSLMLSGDWDGDGVDTVARRDGSTVAYLNSNSTTRSAGSFAYGRADDQILVGDWDGDGRDTLAVRRGNTYYLRNSMDGGGADVTIAYGRADDEVVVGDWDGDGTDTLAVRRGNTYYIKNTISDGAADRVVPYGKDTDTVLAGDWDGDGRDTLAVRRGNTYYVKNTIAGGGADITQPYGRATDRVLVGDWDADRSDTLGVVR